MSLPRSLRLALIADFAALAFVLNQLIDIPAPYLPFLKYEVWEVPIVSSYLLSGTFEFLAVAVINTLLLELKASVISGPFYNLAAILSMLPALYISEKALSWEKINIKNVGIATLLSCAFRAFVMTFVNLYGLTQPYPVGFNIPFSGVVAILPLLAFFNVSTAAYTVPLSYFVRSGIARYARLPVRSLSRRAAKNVTS